MPLEKVEIWFEDEARIGQRGTITRVWAKKGTRPRVIRQQQFEYVYMFGAVCPTKEKAACLVLPILNTYCLEKLLEEISKQVEGHAVIVLDRAAWHTTKKLKCPRNISLLPLPKASPELNPQEQVWQVLRDKYLANKSFNSYEHIMDCCCEAWNNFINENGSISRLCMRDWIMIN